MGKHFFKSLEIKNFRGVGESEIKDLARVNLFVAPSELRKGLPQKPGIGKTAGTRNRPEIEAELAPCYNLDVGKYG